MKQFVLPTVLAAVLIGGFVSGPAITATAMEMMREPVQIENGSSQNALSIVQEGDVGKSRSRSGAIHLDNTKNDYTGLTVYTNAGGSAAQPLVRLEVDNPNWEEEMLYIRSDSPTSRGLIRLDSPAPEIEFVETDQGGGAAGKFELRVQHDTFQINSRRGDDTTFERKIGMTHEGDLVLYEGSLKVEGTDEPAEFAGGINITGGCLAIDGKCVGDVSDLGSQVSARSSEPVSSPQVVPFGAAELSEGTPRSVDCNSYTERGRMALDHENNRLYVCNGPERGWDYMELQN